MNEPKGVKVIHVYDPAVIDYAQWRRWKAKGVYIISREKVNSMAEVIGNNPWDRCDPRNLGVLADDLVGVFCGVMLRRVTYCDPATGKVYTYMTSEMTLPPGLIAFLYKLRWDVEKVFDEKKNKLNQKKAWACSQPPPITTA
ncbi:MAG: transposase [bacterium]